MAIISLFDAQGMPNAALKELLSYAHIDSHQTINALIQVASKVWLRASDQERWQLQENNKDRDYLLHLFDRLAMLQQINPGKTKYDYIIVLGGDLPGMQTRLAYLDALWQKEIRADNIVLLGSDRPLDAEHEKAAITPERTTEFDLIKNYLWHRKRTRILALRSLQQLILSAQMGNNVQLRDTYVDWLSHNPTPGSCLFISSQPHIGYQDAVAQKLFKPPFKIETVGPQASTDTPTAEYFDALARWMHQYRI